MSASVDIARVVSVLRSHAIRHAPEADIQSAIADVLDAASIEYKREARLSGRDRVDFLTRDGVAIELKVDGSGNAVLAQLIRYAEHQKVRGLILVTTRSKHGGLPATLQSKPLHVHIIGGLA